MNEKEILDFVVGNETVKTMSALTFLQWISRKLNGVPAYSAAAAELSMAVRSPPMSRVIPDDEKIRLVRKLLALDVPL